MKYMKIYILSMLFVIAVSTNAVCAVTVAYDPFSEDSLIAQTEDARLAEKITYLAQRKSVSDILSDLNSLTGIKLYSGFNSKDWQVRDRKMNIYVKDIPLARLMSAISGVMKFKWSRSQPDNADYTYRLYMDRKAILEGEAKLMREEKKRAENRSSFVDFCLNPPDMADEDMATIKNDDPVKYLYLKTGISGALGDFFRAVPNAALAMQSGDILNMDSSILPDASLEPLRRLVDGIGEIASTESSEPPAKPDFTKSITVQVNRSSLASCPAYVLGIIRVMDETGRSIGLPIIDPNCAAEKYVAGATNAALDESRQMSDLEKQQADSLFDEDAVESDSVESFMEHSGDPSFEKTIKIPAISYDLPDALKKISESADVNIVSDSFESGDLSVSVSAGEITLGNLLDRVAAQCSYNWMQFDDVTGFRDRFWVKHRSFQIPEAWLNKWRQDVKNRGKLSEKSLSEIKSLAPSQIWANVLSDDILSTAYEFELAQYCFN
jgi:hypothetical protein